MTTRILIVLAAALLATPALAIDEVTFTAAPDVPMTLQVVEPGSEVATVRVAAEHLSAGALEARLRELFGPALDCSVDEGANAVVVTAAPHVVATVQRLVAEIDEPVGQVAFEATVLKVTKKGAKKEVVEGWKELGSWNRAMATQAQEEGLVEIVSAPSVTTVVDRTATIREGARLPREGAPASALSPEGFVHVGYDLTLLPRQVGDRLLVEVTAITRNPGERQVLHELLVMDAREATALRLPGEEPIWLFLSARMIRQGG